MRLLSAVGQGFKSFAKRQKFVFPDEPGFFFLTGDNQVEPQLGANGAGKTTLWDLISWVLFGKTARGLKAGDVGSWYGGEKTGGEVEFEEGGLIYKIVRTWKPNTLKMSVDGGELKPINESDVVDLIKLNHESFLYSILFGQVNPMFFDLKPAPKSELFSAILKLDYWDNLSKKAKSRADHLDGVVHDYNKDIADLQGEIRGLKILNFDQQIKEFEQSKKTRKASLKKDIDDLKRDLEEIKLEGIEKKEDSENLKADYEELSGVVADARLLYNEVNELINKFNRELGALQGELRPLDKELEKFLSVQNEGVCPYCEQEVSSAHIQRELRRLEEEKRTLQNRLNEIKAVVKDHEQEKAEVMDEIAMISKEYDVAKSQYEKAKGRVDELRREASRVVMRLKSLNVAMDEVDNEENPHTKRKQEVEARIELCETEIARYNTELASAEQRAQSVRYWVKGFKEVRLFLISEVLTQLEIEVNNCLFQLGLKDWKIEFATDSETKSGGIRKGFSVMIYSPYNEEPVVWESWSGGESQRLRIAGSLGLANLILARNGVDSFIEIYDEPTQGLNERGIYDLLETLNSRAKELGKQVWIIDHRSLEFGGFKDSFTAVKTEEGTTIVRSEELEAA